MTIRTREQCLVEALYDPQLPMTPAKWNSLWQNSHAQQLSGMLLRHGLLQVVAFLERKANTSKGDSNEEERLLGLLETTMNKVLCVPAFSLSIEYLAKQDALTLLGWSELAIEAAHWIEQVAAAKK